ncbi:MAG: hypothetical protein Kow00127_25290 [Bacteroidales bacterium]
MEWILGYLNEFVWLSAEMAPWLMLGFFFAGLLHVYMPEGMVARYMGSPNLKSVVRAALLGIPLPLCSCGVIPTGISFYREGAAKGPTVSFLISTPQTGVDSILATWSLLGAPFALLRPVVAFFSGIIGGVATNLTTKEEEARQPVRNDSFDGEKPKGLARIAEMFRYAFGIFLMDIAKWLVIGLAIAAFISLVLPDNFFDAWIGNYFLSLLLILAASVPLYVCATGSIPIAAVLIAKGLSPGIALIFLMAGPATNAATLLVTGKALGKRTLITYLASIIGSAVVFGVLTDILLPEEWFTQKVIQHLHHQIHLMPHWVHIASAVILGLLIVTGYIRKYWRRTHNAEPSEMIQTEKTLDMAKTIKVRVEGMTCNHCKMNVERNLSQIEGIGEVVADPDHNEVVITGDHVDLEKIKSTVESIGYSYKGELN